MGSQSRARGDVGGTAAGVPCAGMPGPSELLAADRPEVDAIAATGHPRAAGGHSRGAGAPRIRLRAIEQTEAQVLALIRPYLAMHPKVARIIRVNSGAAMLGDPSDPRFVRFVDIEGQSAMRSAVRRGGPVATAAENQMELVPDILGFLTDGRILAVEVKKSGWKTPSNARERAQERFLQVVRYHGGVAGFCASLRDAENLLREV